MRGVSTGIAVAAALALAAPPAGAVTLPTGYEVRTVADGLTAPTTAAWAPDGRVFVAELAGRVRVVSGGTLRPEPLLDISDHVNSYGDRGLLGIAVDADFERNGYLYLLYTYEDGAFPPDGPKTARLTRVVVRPDGTVAGPETTILGTIATPPCPPPSNDSDCFPSDETTHTIGTVRASPDGTLWVGMGDGIHSGRLGPATRAWDERSYAGKLLHLDRDGRGLPGHPFCPDEDKLARVCTKVYAMGFRNPFRFQLRPGGAGPAVGDVGWSTREEIDLTEPGRDYGWPCYEGDGRTPVYESSMECAERYALEGTPRAATPPDYAYAPGSTGGSVVPGPLAGSAYPADLAGERFVGDFAERRIFLLRLGAAGGPVATPFAGDIGPVELVESPAGNVAFVDAGDWSSPSGRLAEIVHCPANCAPLARARAEPSAGALPLTVSFSAAGSSDPDGDAVTYRWDFGDGSAPSVDPAPVHTYERPGVHRATLTVDDGRGRTDTAVLLVSAGNTPPRPEIDSPRPGASYVPGERIRLSGRASDAEDLYEPPERLHWTVVFHHAEHVHPVMTATGPEAWFAAINGHAPEHGLYYSVTLTATDSAGVSAARTMVVGGPAPPPSPAGPPGGDAAGPPAGEEAPDRTGPAIRFSGRAGARARGGSLTGAVADAGGVAKLRVALRALRRVGGGCRWWSPSKRGLARRPRPCGSPAWMPARVGPDGRWRVNLGGRAPAGRYLAVLRAVDRSGNVSRLSAEFRVPAAG